MYPINRRFFFFSRVARKKILSKRLFFSLSFVLRAVKRLFARREDDDGDSDDSDEAFFSCAKFDGVVSALFY